MTSAIVGTRRPDQIEELIPAGDWNLSKEDADAIEVFLREKDAALAGT